MKQKLLNSIRLRAMMLVAVMCAAFAGQAWADDETIEIIYSNISRTSYDANENTFTQSGITFGYIYAMQNGSNGTPTGWGKNQVIQTKSGGYIYNKDAISGLKKIRVYVVANTNSFTVTSGSTAVPTGNSQTRPATPTGSESITYTKYENKKTTPDQTTTANYYDFDVNNDYFRIAPGGSLYIWKIVLTYSTGPVTPTCATPTFSVAEGTYGSAQNVTITTATEGATIYYTTDGDTPTTSSSVYSSAIAVSSTTTIKAIAVKDGMNNSSVASATYTIVNLTHAGTSEDPYSVADARTAIDADYGMESKYATGIVSEIVTAYSSQYSNITFDIIDQGGSNTLRAYRCGGTDASDVTVGDIVVVSGDLVKYGDIYEFGQGCQLVSLVRKSDSDLTVTSSSPVALEITSSTVNPTSTITWATSSEGDIICTSSDDAVATVTDEGVITAQGAGTATITIYQDADEDYNEGEKTVTVNVTDSRDVVATGIDLTSKVFTKGDIDDLEGTSTMTEGFTGSITYTYESADASILELDGATYEATGVGATTVTVTATPTGGNATNYKPASQEVAVTVNGENSIKLTPTSKTVAFSDETFNITATVPTENYNGTVTATSSNTSVATVSVDGTTVTVTPKAVGTATITVTAGIGTYYPATAQANCTVEFTQPEGSITAPDGEVIYRFYFNDNSDWGFPTTYETEENTYTNVDGKTITLSAPDGYKFDDTQNYFIMGKSGATLTLPAFDKPVTKIDVVGRSGASGKVTQNIFVGDDEVSTATTGATSTNEYEIASEYQAAGNIYTLKVTNAFNTQFTSVVVHMHQAPSTTVQLNTSGYGTFCSVNPMDFSVTDGYTAWRISSIKMENETTGIVTCNKITEAIKGGQGVLLYNKDADGVNKTNVTVTFADGTTEFDDSENLLKGTTAPTYVASNEYFGLSGNNFVKVNAGVVPAGKALLPASEVAGVKSFIFVFNDDATGITETRTATREEVEAIFNLGGQRMSKMQRGVNIVNGKKVLVK